MQRLLNTFFIILCMISGRTYSHDFVADNLTALVQQDVNFAAQLRRLLTHASIPDWAKDARGLDSPIHDMSIGNKIYTLIQSTSPDHTRNQNLVILIEAGHHKMWAMFETYTSSIIRPNTLERQWFGAPNYTQKRILLVSTIEPIN